MLPDGLTVRTVADDASLFDRIEELVELVWPTFIRDGHPRHAARYHGDYQGLYERWPQLQSAILDDVGSVIAAVHCCTLAWNDDESTLPEDGWDWELQSAAEDLAIGHAPKTLGAVSITIHPDWRGRGLSAGLLEIMRKIGADLGLQRLIAPVRPTHKSAYPFTSIDEYITWQTPDGLSIDPWLRTHQRLGARIIHPCHDSMQLEGTVDEWRRWTNQPFATSGEHAFPGGLAPLVVDLENNHALYIEPNVWMVHSLT